MSLKDLRNWLCVLGIFSCTLGCARLPSQDTIIQNYAIDAGTKSDGGDLVGYNNNDLSGFYPNAEGLDDFVSRIALIL